MKQIIVFFIALLCLAYAGHVERLERLTVEDLPKFMRGLRMFSPECNYHGVYYKAKCFCYSQFDGARCETKGTPGWYDTDDKCDDIMSRVNDLMNISPEIYNGDDWEFSRFAQSTIGPVGGDSAAGSNGAPKGAFSWIKMHSLVQSGKTFKIFSSKLESTDIQQGTLGDCYLLAALASLAGIRDGHYLKKAILTAEDNKNNVYITKWNIRGRSRFVSVDDWIPAQSGSDRSTFSSPATNGAFWPIILEKSYAKIHGSYAKIEAGSHDEVWHGLTNAPSYFQRLTEYQNNGNALFQKIKNAVDQDFAVGLSTPGSGSRDVTGHAFSIVGTGVASMKDGSKISLINVFNPHHQDTFTNNAFADASSVWDRVSNKAKFNVENKPDGLYWVQISDILQNYNAVYFSEVRTHYEAHYKDIALKEGTNTYRTTFTLSNVKGEALYVNIETPDERMYKENCKLPFTPKYYTVTTPSGGTLSGKLTRWGNGKGGISKVEGQLKIENPVAGTYTITASVEKSAPYAYVFTINTYSPSGTLEFPNDDAGNVALNKKKCQNDCNGNGRCNFFNGRCSCLNGYSGNDCSIKQGCSSLDFCTNQGSCVRETCQCKSGFYGKKCNLVCKDSQSNCESQLSSFSASSRKRICSLGAENQVNSAFVRSCRKACNQCVE